jgi:hypothetical protein
MCKYFGCEKSVERKTVDRKKRERERVLLGDVEGGLFVVIGKRVPSASSRGGAFPQRQ